MNDTTETPFVRREDLVKILRSLENKDAILVGGQAVSVWAEIYRNAAPELGTLGPITSRDIDFFGFKGVAQDLADDLEAEILLPKIDDHTPNTAVVELRVGERTISIDFLDSILGVSRKQLKEGGVEVTFEYEDEHGRQRLNLSVLHPQLCLQSRVPNILHPATRREDEFSIRQLQVAPYVLRAFVQDKLAYDEHDEVHATLKMLSAYQPVDEVCPGRIAPGLIL